VIRRIGRFLVRSKSFLYQKSILPLFRFLYPGNSITGTYPNLIEWVNNQPDEHKILTISPSERIKEKMPFVSIPSTPKKYQKNALHHNPTITLAEINWGRVATKYCDVISPDNKIFIDMVNTLPNGISRISLSRSELLPKLPELEIKEGTFATIVVYWGLHNYWHWIMDCLARLWVLEISGCEDAKIIVPRKLHSYQTQYLDLLVNEHQREYIGEEFWSIQYLLVPSFVRQIPFAPTEASYWLRDKMLNQTPKSDAQLPKRIFISRARTTRRRLLNEEEVYSKLIPYGFDYIECDKLTVIEQIQLFRQVEAVVGLHGAGLTNILFMPKDGFLLELQNIHRSKPEYWSLANTLGIKYSCVSNEGHLDTGKPPFRDVWIDPEQVVFALTESKINL